MMPSFSKSEQLLARAEKVIPLGTQTFSKSKTQFPFGVSPYYITHGEGGHVWDVDNNEYIDFIMSLNAISLGYNDPDVNAAVTDMVANGSLFSLPHEIEIEVAELLVEMVPCAEMVRFGKNGSDATSGAVRAARAFTGRDKIAICGYHGWQDWYIGTTARNKGVPEATSALSLTFDFNNIQSLHNLFTSHPDEIAAVIMEPMHDEFPDEGFLEGVKELAHDQGALLIFDEMITGFRYANGGAQEYFGVTPDLATFGKGMANGYPLSAVCGRADVMAEFEEIFFSFTYGGETVSLAAAKAALNKYKSEPVCKTMASRGREIIEGIERRIREADVADIISIGGHPTMSSIRINGSEESTVWAIKTLFLQEMFKRGILTYGAHNVCYAHTQADIPGLLSAYDEVLPILGEAVKENKIAQMLDCAPLENLFKVRR